ncbi:hypothetical protein BJX64DRAFT_302235 [Aspergillus heterothallicus]
MPQTVPAYSSISRSTTIFSYQTVDAGLGISYCDMDPNGGHRGQYQPSDHDSADWLGHMMPTELPFGCSLNTSHLSPATFYEPYSGSDASASPLSYCGPQAMSASPSRGPELDYGTGHDMTTTHAYSYWPSTPHSEPDVQVKEDPDLDYRDQSYLERADSFAPISAPGLQPRMNDLPVKTERFVEVTGNTRKSVEAEVDRALTAEPALRPPELRSMLLSNDGTVPHGGQLKIPPASGLTCTVCGAEFTRRSNCREHMKRHDPSGRKLYPCEDCTKTFGRKTDLKRHVDSVHRGIRRFGCDQCGYRFSRQDTLARRMPTKAPRLYCVKKNIERLFSKEG